MKWTWYLTAFFGMIVSAVLADEELPPPKGQPDFVMVGAELEAEIEKSRRLVDSDDPADSLDGLYRLREVTKRATVYKIATDIDKGDENAAIGALLGWHVDDAEIVKVIKATEAKINRKGRRRK